MKTKEKQKVWYSNFIFILFYYFIFASSSNFAGLIQRVMRELLVQVRDGSTNIPNDTQAAIGILLLSLYPPLFSFSYFFLVSPFLVTCHAWTSVSRRIHQSIYSLTYGLEEFPRFLEDTLTRNKRSQLVLIIDGLGILLFFFLFSLSPFPPYPRYWLLNVKSHLF